MAAAAIIVQKRRPIGINIVPTKQQTRFTLHWVRQSGHIIPTDNPAAIGWISQRVAKTKLISNAALIQKNHHKY